jgi:hypothetical protein
MQSKIKKTLLFTRKTLSGFLWKQRPPVQQVLPQPGVWYHSCSQLPFNIFIKIIDENNISLLIISGNPNDEDLYQAWASIYYEYIDLNSTNEQLYLFQLKKEIAGLDFTVVTIEHALYFFSYQPSKELAGIIQAEGFDISFRVIDTATTENESAIITNQLSQLKARLLIRQQELADHNKSQEDQNPDPKYYTKMLLRISKHQGYSIKAKDITVKEFVEALQLYLEDIKTTPEGMENVSN